MFSRDPYKKRLYIINTLISRTLGDFKASRIYKALTLYDKVETENYEIDKEKEEYTKLLKVLEKIKSEDLERLIDIFIRLFDEYLKESRYHEEMGENEKSSLIRPLFYARYLFKIYEVKKGMEGDGGEKVENYREMINERRMKLKEMNLIK